MFDKRADPRFFLNFLRQTVKGTPFKVCNESCMDIIGSSYMMAVTHFQGLSSKTWGDLHRIKTEHYDILHVPILNSLFTSNNPTSGNGNTVAFGSHKYSTIFGDKKNFDTYMSNNFLMVADGATTAKFSVSNG
jgi:hypothetical protein